jgi:tetratricopeptide (TPR) repeat protein
VSSELALHLIRALHLLALSLSPKWLSPEPLPPHPLALWGVGAAAALAAILVASRRFALWLDSRLARAGAALVWVAVAVAIGAALYWSGPRAPLARGAPVVAAPVWAALATIAAASAERWLGSSFKHKRMASAILVLGLGAMVMVYAAPYLGARDQLWWAALRRDGSHERAVEELAGPLLKKRKMDEVGKIADRCLRMYPIREGTAPARPATCACLELRAESTLDARSSAADPALAAQLAEIALQDAQAVRDRCPGRKGSRATLAQALVVAGQSEAAEREVQEGLEEGGDPAALRYALALAYQRAGRYPEAMQEAARAVDAGAGRDARLLAGALAIVAGDLDGAARWLEPLVKQDPGDTQARYNLALIAEKRGDYNAARQGYLATLKADPRNADARYNLALLTFRAGVLEESRHHVRKFIDTFPDDPRGKQLAQTIGLPPPAAGAPPGSARPGRPAPPAPPGRPGPM